MLIDADLVDEISIFPYAGDDGTVDARPTYGTMVTVPARIEDTRKILRTADGTLVDVAMWIACRYDVQARDRVHVPPTLGLDSRRTFPVGHTYLDADGRTPQEVITARGLDGVDGHTEFYL